jgi:hypothetical protein
LGSYRVAEVGELQGVARLSCTHSQDAKEILAELGRLFPQWRIRRRKEYTSDSGDETGWLIDKCEGKHRYALWWLVRQLCSRGWEPVGVAHEPSKEVYTSPVYLFRKRVEV